MTELTQSRKWQLTINNPIEKGYTHESIKALLPDTLLYWCMSDEIGENGTYHTHIYICNASGIRFKTLKKKFPEAHLELCKGTSEDNRAYIQKSGKWALSKKNETSIEGTFEESGELPIERKGGKVSLDDAYDLIKMGVPVTQICDEFPALFLQMDKLEFARQIYLREKYKNTRRDPIVTYIYGASRTGKTRSVMDKYGYENVYRITDYKHPFDNYNGQDIVVFEEFRSSLHISEMLNYLDIYPVELKCRYSNKQALFTKIYVISNIALTEQYPGIDPSSLDAFYHRFHHIQHFEKGIVHQYDVVFLESGFRQVLVDEFVPFC